MYQSVNNILEKRISGVAAVIKFCKMFWTPSCSWGEVMSSYGWVKGKPYIPPWGDCSGKSSGHHPQ
jgi:hypothetical protein